MVAASNFQSKILRRKTTPEEYKVYRAGLEWDLTDPIVIESSDDFKSESRWRGQGLTPYHHQVTNLITFCRRLPVTLLADDVGLGKTISAGLIISELISRSRLSKILIVCPKLLGPQWQAELQQKFDIPSKIAIGKELISADPEDTGAVITTYNSARLYLDEIPEDRFQMLVLDEAHKLRNLYGTQNPPQVAQRFRKALEERRFRFVLMLTATPIQNRLWDLYSLVELLTVARGHQNPFGVEGIFARKFIADEREKARKLRPEAREEFRSIVYSYMSRVRRGDAKLYFPDRRVERHQVDPTSAELELIKTIAKPIQKLNRLAQISILQALTSSPDALLKQLENMARNNTVPPELAAAVRVIVSGMPPSAKLRGLGQLIEQLKKEDPDRWRLVVFTGRRETQTTIQAFLESHGLKVGIINGDSGARNQQTIERFRKNPPDYRVIVSTEAGSEGVNLQVANVLVNYDLPWNPMIVEQRIGRVQRLASDHAHVVIYNITLRGTFEEYIVGRLMEKLQMASQAIGDLEALLQGSDIGDSDEDLTEGFEERIRKLVMDALAGKDFKKATELELKSIDEAKQELERQAENINSMLGSMDGAGHVGPRAPTLPTTVRSMPARDFSLLALKTLGARLTPNPPDLFIAEENGGREYIRFDEHAVSNIKSTLYVPGSAAFQRLVSRIIATGIHDVADLDLDPIKESEAIARKWVKDFDATPKEIEIIEAQRCFKGKALVRVRATVAHDSYERLVEIDCSPTEHCRANGRSLLGPIGSTIEQPISVGLNVEKLTESASLDEGISEFSRFYLERREQETHAAGTDERKRQKLQDEFTPRYEMTLVALEGKLHREVTVRALYTFDTDLTYESLLTMIPHRGELKDAPQFDLCLRSGRSVPISCLSQCQITGAKVLRHLLTQSDISSRLAQPEFTKICSLSGKRVLNDEVESSSVTGRNVASGLLKTSGVSGKRAEPAYFGRCEFTNIDALESELAVSEVSGKHYRRDEQMRSAFSGKTGHRHEFTLCHETRQPIAIVEAERCESTGKLVRPGILETCEVTGKRVLPSECLRCAVTGKRILKRLLVTSSLSQVPILERLAISSAGGNFCSPAEARRCAWSSQKCHPDDIRVCELTGLSVHFEFITPGVHPRLQPLVDILDGVKRSTDEMPRWIEIAAKISAALAGSQCRIESAVLSPNKSCLAVCAEVKTFLGLRLHQAGAIYVLPDNEIIGRVIRGKRGAQGWMEVARRGA
jgi:superfamily II DNA or RNA helicase